MPVMKDLDVHLCDSCGRVIEGEHTLMKANWREWRYHNSPRDCANADELERDWIRNAKKAKANNRTKA
jgi:hypothetical protein